MRFRIILLLSALCVVLLTALTWRLVAEAEAARSQTSGG